MPHASVCTSEVSPSIASPPCSSSSPCFARQHIFGVPFSPQSPSVFLRLLPCDCLSPLSPLGAMGEMDPSFDHEDGSMTDSRPDNARPYSSLRIPITDISSNINDNSSSTFSQAGDGGQQEGQHTQTHRHKRLRSETIVSPRGAVLSAELGEGGSTDEGEREREREGGGADWLTMLSHSFADLDDISHYHRRHGDDTADTCDTSDTVTVIICCY